MFCEHHKSTKYARYRYLLEAKLFLHPLNRGEGDIAELGDIPQALALPSHLHAFRFRQLSSLGQAEVDILALLFRAKLDCLQDFPDGATATG